MSLIDYRRFYAEEIRFAAPVKSSAVIEAFARVPREKFLGPGPWRIASVDLSLGGTDYITTPDADPRHVHHNVAIALDSTRDLNNGQPAALARWIDVLDLRPGNRVFHLGCGVGYYTAVMAELVGPDGHVEAVEVDSELTARAQQNLAEYRQVTVHAGDGLLLDPGPCDAMLINAGVTHPHAAWLDHLREGGCIVLPLTVAMQAMGTTLGKGVMAKITRTADAFAVRVVSFVAIYSSTSGRDPQLEPLLGKALATGALLKIKSVRRDAHQQSDTCVLHGPHACLSTSEIQNVVSAT